MYNYLSKIHRCLINVSCISIYIIDYTLYKFIYIYIYVSRRKINQYVEEKKKKITHIYKY